MRRFRDDPQVRFKGTTTSSLISFSRARRRSAFAYEVWSCETLLLSLSSTRLSGVRRGSHLNELRQLLWNDTGVRYSTLPRANEIRLLNWNLDRHESSPGRQVIAQVTSEFRFFPFFHNVIYDQWTSYLKVWFFKLNLSATSVFYLQRQYLFKFI